MKNMPLLMLMLLLAIISIAQFKGPAPHTKAKVPPPEEPPFPTSFDRQNIVTVGNMDEDHRTISSALEAAGRGTVIKISPGIYSESLLLKNGITISGEGDKNAVVINGEITTGNYDTVYMNNITFRDKVRTTGLNSVTWIRNCYFYLYSNDYPLYTEKNARVYISETDINCDRVSLAGLYIQDSSFVIWKGQYARYLRIKVVDKAVANIWFDYFEIPSSTTSETIVLENSSTVWAGAGLVKYKSVITGRDTLNGFQPFCDASDHTTLNLHDSEIWGMPFEGDSRCTINVNNVRALGYGWFGLINAYDRFDTTFRATLNITDSYFEFEFDHPGARVFEILGAKTTFINSTFIFKGGLAGTNGNIGSFFSKADTIYTFGNTFIDYGNAVGTGQYLGSIGASWGAVWISHNDIFMTKYVPGVTIPRAFSVGYCFHKTYSQGVSHSKFVMVNPVFVSDSSNALSLQTGNTGFHYNPARDTLTVVNPGFYCNHNISFLNTNSGICLDMSVLDDHSGGEQVSFENAFYAPLSTFKNNVLVQDTLCVGTLRGGKIFEQNGNLILSNNNADKDIIFNAFDGAVGTQPLFIDGSLSRIGLFTTEPLLTFHVNGEAWFGGKTNNIVTLSRNSGSASYMDFKNTEGEWTAGISPSESFTLRNVTTNTTPFEIYKNAPEDAIFISATGTGFGKTPLENLHVYAPNGNEVAFRLENSNPQVWDIQLSNLEDFEIQDVTFGATVITIPDKTKTVIINDVLRLTPRNEGPYPASEGMIYVSSEDHHIYCYLQGNWVKLD